MKSVILHVTEDTDAAESLCDLLGRHNACPVTLVAGPAEFSADTTLLLIWSARAATAGAARRFVEIARAHAGTSTLCRIDSTPTPPSLAAAVDGSMSGRTFARAANWRLPDEIDASEEARTAPPSFASGFVRGFVGAVSVLGFTGALAVGVSQHPASADSSDFAEARTSQIDAATAAAVSYDAHAVDLSQDLDLTEEGLVSDADLKGLGAALMRKEATEHADVEARLDAAMAELYSIEATRPFQNYGDRFEGELGGASAPAVAPAAAPQLAVAAPEPALNDRERAAMDALAELVTFTPLEPNRSLLAQDAPAPVIDPEAEIRKFGIDEYSAPSEHAQSDDLWSPRRS